MVVVGGSPWRPPPPRSWGVRAPLDCRRREVVGGHGWLPPKVSGGVAGRSPDRCTQRARTLGMGPRSFWSDLWLLCEWPGVLQSSWAVSVLGYWPGLQPFSCPRASPPALATAQWGAAGRWLPQETPARGLHVGGQWGRVASSCCARPPSHSLGGGEHLGTVPPSLCVCVHPPGSRPCSPGPTEWFSLCLALQRWAGSLAWHSRPLPTWPPDPWSPRFLLQQQAGPWWLGWQPVCCLQGQSRGPFPARGDPGSRVPVVQGLCTGPP